MKQPSGALRAALQHTTQEVDDVLDERRDPLLERVLVYARPGLDDVSARTLGRAGLWAVACSTIDELCAAVAEGAAAVVIAEGALSTEARRRLAATLAAQPKWSDLPVVLCTSREMPGANGLGSSARQDFGNVLVVEAPMKTRSVVAAIHAGLRARRRQVDLRDVVVELERSAEERARLLEREHAARTDAEAANRAKDEFLAMISHELRTPLNAILGWSRMMTSGRLSAAQHERAAQTIERNAVAQAKLVDELLDVSRIIAGKLTLRLCPVDLRAIVESAVESLRIGAETKGLTLRVTLALEPARVMGDPERLTQIANNLIANAIKFTPAGGCIDVVVTIEEGASARLSVRDDGIGIDEGLLAFVFDRFRQGDSSRTRTHGGLGLGLALVRHLVDLHGGAVSASSAGKGQGAELLVTIPLLASSGLRGATRASADLEP